MYNVLIVDDEKVVRIGLQTLITWEEHGCKIAGTAQDGVQALEMIQTEPIDIVITDLKMPKMDGLTLVKSLKELGFDGGMIILTNYGEFEMAREALRYGVKDYLLKATLRANELISAVERTTKDLKLRVRSAQDARQQEEGISEKEIAYLEKLFCEERELEDLPRIYQFLYIRQIINKYQKQSITTKPFSQFKESIANIIKEITGFNRKVHLMFLENGAICFFEQGLFSREQLMTMGRQIQTHIKLYTTLDMISVIGEAFHNQETFREHFFKSKVASQLVFYRGMQSPLVETDSDKVKTYIKIEDKVFLKNLEVLIKGGKGHEAIEAMSQFLNAFEKLGVPVDDAWEWLDGLINRMILDYGMYFEKHKELLQNISIRYRQCIRIKEVEAVLGELITLLCNYTSQVEKEDCREEIAKIKRYIQKNWHMKITLNAIATEVNMNESYISRLFKQETGVNLVSYISMVKMERAKEMLKDPNMRVKDVANELGFEEQSYFNRLFKKYFGVNPNDYKKN